MTSAGGETGNIPERFDGPAGVDLRQFLADAGILLSSSLDYEVTLQNVARLAVPVLADWCFVHLLAPDNSVRRVAVAHADPDDAEIAAFLQDRPPDPARPHPVYQALRSGESLLLPDLSDERLNEIAQGPEHLARLRALGARSSLVVLIPARGQILGTIHLLTSHSGRRYGPADRALAEDLARRAGLAIDNARLFQDAQAAIAAWDEALAAVEAERARLRQVLDVLPEAIRIVDPAGRVLLTNTAAREMLGPAAGQSVPVSDGEVQAQYYPRRLDGTPLTATELPLRRALDRGMTTRGEQMLYRQPDTGRDIVVLLNCAPLLAPDGSIAGAVSVFQDITALKDLERARDDFLSALSHDLKTPLTTIQGLAQLALRYREPEHLTQRLEGIVAATTQMMSLIGELLDVARLRTPRAFAIHRRPTDLVDLVRRVAAEHQQATTRHAVRVEGTVERLIGEWDSARLERVVANLLSNAIKYSPRGGDIVLRIATEREAERGWAVVQVCDSGIGIPAADLPFIFDRFRRAVNVGHSIPGTGIGLASVHQIVDQHGGSVTVTSQEGAGSTFTVRLPLSTVSH